MASRPPRFERTIERAAPRPDPSAGAEYDFLSQQLEAFSAARAQDLHRLAEERGFQEGLESPGELTGSQLTTQGRAFNRGATVAHQAALQTDLRDTISRFELEHEADPEGFQQKLQGMTEGLLEEADPTFHPFIRERANDYAGRAQVRILARQQQQLQAQAVDDLNRGAKGFIEDATTAAFEGDILLIEARRQELNQLMSDGVAGGLVDAGAAADMLLGFEREVTSQEVIGEFDRLVRSQGPLAGTDAIQRWQKVKPSEVGLTPADHESVTRQMIALKNREEALLADRNLKRTAEMRAEHNLRKGRVDDAIGVLSAGFPIDREQAKQVAEDVTWLRSTGEADDLQRADELAHKLDVANAIQSTVHQFRRAPPTVRAQEIARLEGSLRTGGASIEEVALVKALKAADSDVSRQLADDPRGFLNREGMIEDPALDFSSAEALAESIAARDTDIGQALTGEPVPRLSAAEADQLAQVYQAAEIEEKVAILGVISFGAGPDAEATLEQLDAKGYRSMALMGSFVMAGQGELAREVMRGEIHLAAEPAMMPKRLDYQIELDRVWGTALADWPEQRALYRDAAFAKYAELKARRGDLSDVYDSNLMKEALRAVLPTAPFNGRRVARPAGVSRQAFDAWVDQWSATDFEGIAGADPADMLELVNDRGRLIELGNGRYGIAVESAISGTDRWLLREDGEPFVLSFPRPEPPPLPQAGE